MSRLNRILKAVRKELVFKRVTAVEVPAKEYGDRFAGKLALVTGGASGIGFAIAERLAYGGCKVVIAGRNRQRLQDAVALMGVDVVRPVELDVTEVDSIASKIEAASMLFPEAEGFDILVNSAGTSAFCPFGEVDERAYDTVLDTNLKGTFFVSQAMANHMISRDIQGRILNVSSSSALRSAKSPYEISKWGIKGMTLGFADELIRYGIVVNAIAPGPTATEMIKPGVGGDLLHVQSPIGRLADPREIAELALVLLGDEGALVVGDTLYATGGAGTICIDR